MTEIEGLLPRTQQKASRVIEKHPFKWWLIWVTSEEPLSYWPNSMISVNLWLELGECSISAFKTIAETYQFLCIRCVFLFEDVFLCWEMSDIPTWHLVDPSASPGSMEVSHNWNPKPDRGAAWNLQKVISVWLGSEMVLEAWSSTTETAHVKVPE